MGKTFRCSVFLALAAILALCATACSKPDAKNETVATVNGEDIKVGEMREILGVRGGSPQAAQVPPERKKEALDRLVTDRLLEQDARRKGLDNTAEFKKAMTEIEPRILASALFSKEMDGKAKAVEKEVEAESGKLREADKSLSEKEAVTRARRKVLQASTRKLQDDVLAAAKKDVPSTVDQNVMDKIGKAEQVADNAVLATVGSEKITLGEIRKILQSTGGGMHAGRDLSDDPIAIRRILDRDLKEKTLVAYAKKQKIEGSEWAKTIRKGMERSVLINMLTEKVATNEISVTDKELADAYKEHAQMFMRDGRKVPFDQVKEQLRGFLRNNKRRKALEAYIEELKRKAKITIDESALSKV